MLLEEFREQTDSVVFHFAGLVFLFDFSDNATLISKTLGYLFYRRIKGSHLDPQFQRERLAERQNKDENKSIKTCRYETRYKVCLMRYPIVKLLASC